MSGRAIRIPTARRIRLAVSLFALGILALGCDTGTSPRAATLTVVNDNTADASLSWQSPGLLGTPLLAPTGTDPIAGCQTHIRRFGPGLNAATVMSGGQSLSLTLEASDAAPATKAVLISSTGSISEVDPSALPTVSCSLDNPQGSPT